MFTAKRIQNRQCREVGEMPADYQHRIRSGDRVRVRIVSGTNEYCLDARVLGVQDHGWYSEAVLLGNDGARRTVRLWHDAVPEDGVIECVIVQAIAPPPHPDEGHSLSHDHLERLAKPEPCPKCEQMINRKPRAGWPCWACRIREQAESARTSR